MTTRLLVRSAALGVLGLLGVLVGASPASAHAALVSSSPEPGSELANAPGFVTLAFSESLIEKLSRATVTDPDGQRFEGEASGERDIRVPLRSNLPGVYAVDWKTVSPVDGHTLEGSFRFGVGVDPGSGAAAQTGTTPRRDDLLVATARAVEYAALLFAVGGFVVAWLAARQPVLAWGRPRLVAALAVALVAGVTVVVGEALLAARSPSAGALADYFGTDQGAARLTRVGAEAIALLVALRWRALAMPFVALALVALAGAGHAAAAQPSWWAVASDTLHLVAAGAWVGGILVLATLRPPDGWRGPEGRTLLERFSPVAVGAFVITVTFGVVRSTQELAGVGELISTAYGRVLGVKVLLVAAMVPLSLLAWTRRARSHRREATVALAVAMAAALLAAFPLPPRRVAEADASAHPGRAGSELPEAGDLTIGGNAGDTLVALTVRPAAPGRNRVLVTLIPTAAERTGPPPAELAVGGQRLDLERCGPRCRTITLTLAGREQLSIHVAGPGGGDASFTLPQLPPPDGTQLLQRFTARMEALDSYRLDEVFGPEPPVRSSWTVVAPDRLQIVFADGTETIRIGDASYRRESPEQPWQRSSGPTVRVPSHIWDVAERSAARIVGTERVDGVDTQILSFLGTVSSGGDTPIWYRVWVDDTGLVHRAEMRTAGHFMDHRYFDFDAPLDVEPPAL
ncbi:MAG: copper resistance CopC/CopD family protein [Acidimicrobiia bacterium]